MLLRTPTGGCGLGVAAGAASNAAGRRPDPAVHCGSPQGQKSVGQVLGEEVRGEGAAGTARGAAAHDTAREVGEQRAHAIGIKCVKNPPGEGVRLVSGQGREREPGRSGHSTGGQMLGSLSDV